MTSLASMTSKRLVRNTVPKLFICCDAFSFFIAHYLLTLYPVFTDKQPARAAYQTDKLPKVWKMMCVFILIMSGSCHAGSESGN